MGVGSAFAFALGVKLANHEHFPTYQSEIPKDSTILFDRNTNATLKEQDQKVTNLTEDLNKIRD